uniref:Putative secreted protein n=1 Tax=Anopheles darlingi TaxID=43151 RepID=A0A2M4DC42_ANODA
MPPATPALLFCIELNTSLKLLTGTLCLVVVWLLLGVSNASSPLRPPPEPAIMLVADVVDEDEADVALVASSSCSCSCFC